MKYLLAAFGCALTLALMAPMVEEAKADGYSAPARAYRPVVFAHKKCIAPARDGAKVSWVCRASETCCYDWLLRKGTCTTRRCF